MKSFNHAKQSLASVIAGLTLSGSIAFAPLGLASSPLAAPPSRQQAEQSESWRKQPPAPSQPRPLRLPAMREVKLENGLTLLLLEDHRAPLVTMFAGIPQAVTAQRAMTNLTNLMTLAEATGELLTEGAGARTSQQLARDVESLGGQLSSSASDDFVVLSASCIAENAERMMSIFSDVLMRPTFPQAEVALYKNNRIEKLTLARQEPAFLVQEHFNRAVFGAHPYGFTAPPPEAVRALTRTAIARFYQSHYSPAAAVVIMAGDFEAAQVEAQARASLGKWQHPTGAAPKQRQKGVRTTAKRMPLARPQPAAQRIYLIDRPGSSQADFRIGQRAVAHADADYTPLIVMNAILGDGTSSRLFLNVREQKGYAYDVSSQVRARKAGGAFFGAAETRTEVTLPAIREMLAEFERLSNEKVSAEDLRNAKNYLTGLFSLTLSTQGGMAEAILETRLLGLAADDLETFRARVEAVTADDVQRVARRYLAPERAAIVVVGDAAKLKPALAALGPVVLRNAKAGSNR
jgi:zinc protease